MPRKPNSGISDAARIEFETECLSAIYRMTEDGKKVTQESLDEFIEATSLAKPSLATRSCVAVVRRFKKDDLADVSSRAIALTRKGLRQAEAVVRTQRIAECAVANIFRVDIHDVAEEAYAFAKGLTSKLEVKVLEMLGNPSVSPYGYPIPGVGQTIQKRGMVRLSEAQEGAAMTVGRIPVESRDLLDFLFERGIIPGESVLVNQVSKVTEIISFVCGGKDCVVAHSVGEGIWLYPASTDAQSTNGAFSVEGAPQTESEASEGRLGEEVGESVVAGSAAVQVS